MQYQSTAGDPTRPGNNPINPILFDMATTLKSIGDFSAAADENVEEWLDRIRMVSSCAGLGDQEAVRAGLLNLGGEARTWATQHWESLIGLSLDQFSEGIKARFAKTRETAEVLSRFFASPQSATYADYTRLLRDASVIFRRGSHS